VRAGRRVITAVIAHLTMAWCWAGGRRRRAADRPSRRVTLPTASPSLLVWAAERSGRARRPEMLARRQDAAAPVVPAATGRRPVVGTVDHRGRIVGMRGKTVLVTGASSGIGLAASRHLAALGAALIMVSRDPIRGAAARDEVAAVAVGPQPVFVAADLSSQQAIRLLADQLHTRHERLDVLINNAGTWTASSGPWGPTTLLRSC
jgi:NADPH:quinone reductase-like Zn-dependent oxidoreductase